MDNTVKETIAIDFNIGAIKNKVLHHLQSQLQMTNLLYHAATEFQQPEIPNLPTDDLPIFIANDGIPTDTDTVRTKATSWLFKKAIEEIIIGLTESLVEAYKFIEYLHLAETVKTTVFSARDDVFTTIEKIGTAAMKMHFPGLLEAIEKATGQPVYLKKEILSINAVRNCLVHRNGWVTAADIKSPAPGELILSYQNLRWYFQQGEEWKPFTWQDKINGNISGPVAMRPENLEKNFPIGALIIIDHNTFNAP